MFDAADFDVALACAEEAARQAPRSVEAHHNRAVALLRLDRVDEARDALTLALTLAPEDPETLEAAADLNINQLPPSADRSAIGLELARRAGRRLPRRSFERAARLALLEGQALLDLGRSTEALRRIDVALSLAPRLAAAQYERGVALFELCRFAEARRMFEKVLANAPDHGHALYHLALIDERAGDEAGSVQKLHEAMARDPKSFPPPPSVTVEQFEEHVGRALANLPPGVQNDLAGVQVEAAELPLIEDLTAESPPLSPTILGLFRGLPLDWKADQSPPQQAGRAGKGPGRGASSGAPAIDDSRPAAPAAPARAQPSERTIVLYRRNLLRTVRDEKELDQAIMQTLLHEVGHLRGEDDGSLRDRGLE
jgi:predicted Zn-dependent protease with MMP-like domain